MFLLRALVLSSAMMMSIIYSPSAAARCETQSFEQTGAVQPVHGESVLCERRWGLQADVRLDGLEPAHAYTLWWVYFGDVTQCAEPGDCQYVDLLPTSAEFYPGYAGCPIDDSSCTGAQYPPVGVVGRMGGLVASSSGTAWVRDRLYRVNPPPEAELWLVVLGHGPAEASGGRALARQLLTPQDPVLGAPHLGTETDGSRSEWLAISRHLETDR